MKIQSSFQANESSGILYLVPTPIGNLEDMTFRAVRILQEVDKILAEDTRNSGKLLKHFDIMTSMQAFHEFTSDHQVEEIIEQITRGQDYALISDAGMPLINDPGHPLVQACLENDLSVVALPGANAALTALIASGLPGDQFTYYGFFPRKESQQVELIGKFGQREETAIFYESPHRIKKTITVLSQHLLPNSRIVLGRELTKRYETYIRGTVEEIQIWLESHTIKGEIVLLIQGACLIKDEEEDLANIPIRDQVQALLDTGSYSPNEAIKHVAKTLQMKKNEVYAIYHNL